MELKGAKVFTPAEEAVKKVQLFKGYFDSYPFTTRCDPVEAFPYSDYIKPYHFKRPITGQKTNEAAWNAARKDKRSATS